MGLYFVLPNLRSVDVLCYLGAGLAVILECDFAGRAVILESVRMQQYSHSVSNSPPLVMKVEYLVYFACILGLHNSALEFDQLRVQFSLPSDRGAIFGLRGPNAELPRVWVSGWCHNNRN